MVQPVPHSPWTILQYCDHIHRPERPTWAISLRKLREMAQVGLSGAPLGGGKCGPIAKFSTSARFWLRMEETNSGPTDSDKANARWHRAGRGHPGTKTRHLDAKKLYPGPLALHQGRKWRPGGTPRKSKSRVFCGSPPAGPPPGGQRNVE
eukprot:gene9040-biopygen21197